MLHKTAKSIGSQVGPESKPSSTPLANIADYGIAVDLNSGQSKSLNLPNNSFSKSGNRSRHQDDLESKPGQTRPQTRSRRNFNDKPSNQPSTGTARGSNSFDVELGGSYTRHQLCNGDTHYDATSPTPYSGPTWLDKARHRSRSGHSRGRTQTLRPLPKTLDYSRFIKKVNRSAETAIPISGQPFDRFGLNPRILEVLQQRNYLAATPIQNQSMTHILAGKDLVGLANTGTGKTAAFLLPLIHKTLENPKLQTIILAPTRELAQQIRQELIQFTPKMPIYSICLVGGTSIEAQVKRLDQFHHFVIGTPGRIRDLLQRRRLRLDRTQHLVLDEMDRMLDMGFIDDLRFILNQLPKKRQSLFFSATLPKEVENLMTQFLQDPVIVSVRTDHTSDSVNQDIIRVPYGQNKIEILHDLLIKTKFTKIIIFGQTKMGVERLTNELQNRGFKAEAIHGDKTQSKRQQALHMFKTDKVNILVATDVAARGLDIPAVSHVINYELPQNYQDYIHRIGRTGRANQIGQALTFVD